MPLIVLPGPVAAVRLWLVTRSGPQLQIGADARRAMTRVVRAVAVSAVTLAGLVCVLGIAGASLSSSDSPRGIPLSVWLVVVVSATVPTALVLSVTFLAASTGRAGWTALSGLLAPVLMLAPYLYVASLSY